MPTTFQHRIILIVPVAKVAAVVTWFQGNVGPNAVPADLGPGLSASGSLPATHNWCCGSWIDADAKAILVKLCQLAGVAVPTVAQWDNATRAQKRTWLLSVQAAILSSYGAFVTLADNEGNWDSPATALAAMSLQVIQG